MLIERFFLHFKEIQYSQESYIVKDKKKHVFALNFSQNYRPLYADKMPAMHHVEVNVF